MEIDGRKIKAFRAEIWRFYKAHGRDLPWRRTRDPYRIFVSELMLQQTQVARALVRYPAFVRRFPDFTALSRAKKRNVLAAWQGLGYNRRAVALWNASKAIVRRHRGRLPRDEGSLIALPGVGKGTAGALRAFAYDLPAVFIETNIRRVFIHFFFPGKKNVSDAALMPFIERALDRKRPREWYSALMDYGAMLGGREKENPNVRSAHYKRQGRFKGSRRELRGKVLAYLLAHQRASEKELSAKLGFPLLKTREAVASLKKDGLLP